MTFLDVRKLSTGGLNRRLELNSVDGHRQLQSSSPFELKCILSDIDVRQTNLVIYFHEIIS